MAPGEFAIQPEDAYDLIDLSTPSTSSFEPPQTIAAGMEVTIADVEEETEIMDHHGVCPIYTSTFRRSAELLDSSVDIISRSSE